MAQIAAGIEAVRAESTLDRHIKTGIAKTPTLRHNGWARARRWTSTREFSRNNDWSKAK